MNAAATDQRKVTLAQYFTAPSVAQFMASLFSKTRRDVHLLDAGAGAAALTVAFVERWKSGTFGAKFIHAVLYELDVVHAATIPDTLAALRFQHFTNEVLTVDFLTAAVDQIESGVAKFTHAILNPPYKKIGTDSDHRKTLRRAGIETVNLYSAFVALAIKLMARGGEVVAIVPRSFCNGPYYRPFRELILTETAVEQIHLFASRTKAFKKDGVLQENVILKLKRGAKQGAVTISTSTDDSFWDYAETSHDFAEIVSPTDQEKFIHVPTGVAGSDIPGAVHTLKELGLTVSTGPVVDFRTPGLSANPAFGTVPLLYPIHVSGMVVRWPIGGAKKPNAIADTPENLKWLFPVGNYCVVRRFSSKEEKRRIVATFVPAADFPGYQSLGFENHLNVFHASKQGLPEQMARGLAVYLNTTAVDSHFRRFSGHTQVNATDLRKLLYPPANVLLALGQQAAPTGTVRQEDIDAAYENALV